MAEMDVLQSKIIQQIEVYLTEDNLKNDYTLAKYEHENDGWIPVERLNQFNKLSTYKYETVLNALLAKRSNVIELDLCEPACLRRRRQPLIEPSIKQNPYLYQTVVVNGLPRDAQHDELMAFFNRFYPVHTIKMLPSARAAHSFSGKIRVVFEKCQDALAFVQRSESVSLIYVNEYVLQLCNGYTLICKMLIDCDDKDEDDLIKQTDQLRLESGQSFCHRYTATSPRVSFSTNLSLSNNDTVRPKQQTAIYQTKSCLKSSTCATEQILFCQNATDSKLSKALEYRDQAIVSNRYSYEFYIPDHLLQQTHACMIVAALNPHCFTVQLKQDAIEFDKFQREINDFYNEIDSKEYLVTPEQIRANLCVICADPKSSDDDKIWNRSQILDFDPVNNTVNLFYVDLGTWDEYVPIVRLRHLIDSFHRHLVFSLTCRLAHVSPTNDDADMVTWPDDATDQFLAVIDQAVPEIELLVFGNDGCFQTNLFVINSGEYVCVNDYMIHIKKAKAILQSAKAAGDQPNTCLVDTDSIANNVPAVHPVIALYNRLGELLKRSSPKSCPSLSNNLSQPTKSVVKLMHIRTVMGNMQRTIPLVFIHYEKAILLPDFNICSLLKLIHSNIDIDTLERYAVAIKYRPMRITRECYTDVFTQINCRSLHCCVLYSIEFVRSLLAHYRFPVSDVFLALDKAKFAQMSDGNLSLWFTIDNELIKPSDGSRKLNPPTLPSQPETKQSSANSRRLPFSNRLISPT